MNLTQKYIEYTTQRLVDLTGKSIEEIAKLYGDKIAMAGLEFECRVRDSKKSKAQ